MTRPRRAAVVATLAAAAAWCAPAPATSATEPVAGACEDRDGVTVVVDYNELGDRTQVACVRDAAGLTATRIFAEAGFPLEYQPQMQDFVCKVTGVPDDRPCTEGDSYWSLWWAPDPSSEWSYATLGVGSLEVPEGGSVGFAWHEGAGDAEPPDTTPAGEGADQADAVSPAAREDDAPGAATPEDDGVPTWAIAVIAVLALGAAGAVPILRRRGG